MAQALTLDDDPGASESLDDLLEAWGVVQLLHALADRQAFRAEVARHDEQLQLAHHFLREARVLRACAQILTPIQCARS